MKTRKQLTPEMIRKLGIIAFAPLESDETDPRTQRSFEAMLMALKPYNVWLETASKEVIQAVRETHGSPRAFYEKFRAALEEGVGLRRGGSGEHRIA